MTEKTNGYNVNADKDPRWEEVEVPVPWGHISGKWWGSRAKQPIIAMHGWQDNAGSFDRLAPLLAEEGFSVYAIDLPGHGLSSHLPPGCTYYLMWDGVQCLRRIVKHFGWKKITIMGHSMGGGIGFLYSAIFPEDVDRYMSFDVACATVMDTTRAIGVVADCIDKSLKFEDPIFQNQIAYSYEDMISLVYEAHKGALTRESCEIILKRGTQLSEDGEGYIFTRDPRLTIAGLGVVSAEYSMAFAGRIKCKVMNVKAIDGMTFQNYEEILDKIATSAKQLVRQRIPGNHHVHLNDPEFISEIVTDFMRN